MSKIKQAIEIIMFAENKSDAIKELQTAYGVTEKEAQEFWNDYREYRTT